MHSEADHARNLGGYMLCRLPLLLAAALLAGSLSLHAQEPVVGAIDPEALFHSSDPKLNTNKQAKVVSVVAEGDLVVVAYVRELKDATTWFDMWYFKDGKADEHWDPATRVGP